MQYVVFGKMIYREGSSLTDLFTKRTNNLNKQIGLKKRYNLILLYCICVVDPATFLASNSALGTLFSSDNSLFIHL